MYLASYFHQSAPTLLVDGDPNRSVSRWAARGEVGFPVVTENQAALHARKYQNIIIDTKARPEENDLRELATGCHLLILPCPPEPLSVDALLLTVEALRSVGTDRFRVLLTLVPPYPNKDGQKAREALEQAGLRLFKAQIPRAVAYQRCVLAGSTTDSSEYKAVGREINEALTQFAD